MRIASVGLLLVVVSACTGPGGPGDGPDGGGDDGPDGGRGGPPTAVDLGCVADEDCGAGTVCDKPTGACIAGFDCTQNSTICGFCGDADVDCGFGVAVAYCDEAAGVCRRAKGTCEACLDDAECAAADNGLPSPCIDGFCAAGCGACPPGFLCTQGGCVPAPAAGQCDGATLCGDGAACPDGTRCSDLGVCLTLCTADADCPADRYCFTDPGPLDEQCIEKCPLGTLNGAGDRCHADGRFGDPCPTPDATTGCPAGTVCRADGTCILTGCQSDADCPLVRTYCDTTTSECVEGCNDVGDCGAFETCEGGQCVAGGCRSADSSCELGEFCCGADLYEDGACGDAVDDGSCFLAPDPFCRPCEDDEGCADIQAFGFASFCYELKDQNDQSLGKYCSVGCVEMADCPRGVPCRAELPTPEDGVTTQGCLDARCQLIAAARE